MKSVSCWPRLSTEGNNARRSLFVDRPCPEAGDIKLSGANAYSRIV